MAGRKTAFAAAAGAALGFTAHMATSTTPARSPPPAPGAATVDSGYIELVGPGANALREQYTSAEAKGPLRCDVGGSVNHPRELYCTDGRRAGFILGRGIDLPLDHASVEVGDRVIARPR